MKRVHFSPRISGFLLFVSSFSTAGAVTLKPCFLNGIAEQVRCGTLTVDEDRDRHASESADGKTIDLQIAVLPAIEQPAAPDPMVILAGGPGQSARAIAASVKAAMSRINVHRDIVLVDQRGTGESNPLDCDFDLNSLAFDAQSKVRAVRECVDALDADVRHYTTINHVLDLEDVRRALGYAQVNLYGGSYGTRVAQVYLREFPGAVRTATLDAVASMDLRVGLQMGADADEALDAIFARCEQLENCRQRFPNLRKTLDNVLGELRQSPLEMDIEHPVTGEISTETLDHRMFAIGLRGLLYSPSTQRAVPLLIDHASRGNFRPFIGLSTAATTAVTESMEPGLLFAVLCAEDFAGLDRDSIPQRERASFLGTAQADEFFGFCEAWPQPLVPASWEPAAVDVPVLLLSGSLDPVTRPSQAEAVARSLPNARHIVVPNAGHTVVGSGCVPDLLTRFVDTADPTSPDAECVKDFRTPAFFLNQLGPIPELSP